MDCAARTPTSNLVEATVGLKSSSSKVDVDLLQGFDPVSSPLTDWTLPFSTKSAYRISAFALQAVRTCFFLVVSPASEGAGNRASWVYAL